MTRTERFAAWCEREGIELLPHQRTYAAGVLASDEMTLFHMGGRGSGRTFIAAKLDQFCDEERRVHAG